MKLLLYLALVFTAMQSYSLQSGYDKKVAATNDYTTAKQGELLKVNRIPFKQWTSGMRFILLKDYLREDKITYVKNKREKYGSVKSDSLDRKIATIERLEADNFTFTVDERRYMFLLDYSIIKGLSDIVDGLVYLDDIDAARKALIGNTYFITTRDWLTDREDGGTRQPADAKKYTAVKIIDIGVSTYQHSPLKIIFEYGNHQQAYINASVHGTNDIGIPSSQLDNLLTRTDLRKMYPMTKDDVWSLIETEKVRVGMTGEECRLSWGEPKNINTTTDATGNREQWVYEGKSYLYFEQGVLTAIQN